MDITKEIREAIMKATVERGGVSAFARKTALTPAQISKFKKGSLTRCSYSTLQKMLPILSEYLPSELTEKFKEIGLQTQSITINPLTQHLLKKWELLDSDAKRYQALQAIDGIISENR